MAKDKTQAEAGRPAKRAKLLDDDDASSVSGGEEVSFKINEEFARRFEYNKKREEKQRRMSRYALNSSFTAY